MFCSVTNDVYARMLQQTIADGKTKKKKKEKKETTFASTKRMSEGRKFSQN
jgi:hypothetical protein